LEQVKKQDGYQLKSFQRDIEFHEKLYSLGKPKAAIYLGIFNEAAGNFEAAESWYSKASNLVKKDAAQSEKEVVDSAGDTYADLQTYRSHALEGNATAIFLYATLIDMQDNPAREDVILWYEKAAALGRSEAAEHLADYYWAGKYVPKNWERACFWGRKIPKDRLGRWRYKFLCRF
jgi:TPR repeat protein